MMKHTATTETDVKLLHRMAMGHEDALGELYERHARALLPIALRILRTRTDAEDVLHDALLIVCDRSRQYVSERGSVVTWLAAIVRNLSIDRVRARSRRHQLLESYRAPIADDNDLRSLVAIDAGRARAALQRLPVPTRSAFELAFFEGLSLPEVAEREEVPLGTIKSRMSRGLRQLRALLEDEVSPEAARAA